MDKDVVMAIKLSLNSFQLTTAVNGLVRQESTRSFSGVFCSSDF